eukprot:5623-Pelagomonas_calceolata.AAC.8
MFDLVRSDANMHMCKAGTNGKQMFDPLQQHAYAKMCKAGSTPQANMFDTLFACLWVVAWRPRAVSGAAGQRSKAHLAIYCFQKSTGAPSGGQLVKQCKQGVFSTGCPPFRVGSRIDRPTLEVRRSDWQSLARPLSSLATLPSSFADCKPGQPLVSRHAPTATPQHLFNSNTSNTSSARAPMVALIAQPRCLNAHKTRS